MEIAMPYVPFGYCYAARSYLVPGIGARIFFISYAFERFPVMRIWPFKNISSKPSFPCAIRRSREKGPST